MQTHITGKNGKNGHDPKLLEACQRVIDRDRTRFTRGSATSFGSVTSASEMVSLYLAYIAMANNPAMPRDIRENARAVVERVERELALVSAMPRGNFASREPQVERAI